MSALRQFDQLYRKAAWREHVAILEANSLWQSAVVNDPRKTSFLDITNMAKSLLKIHADFDERMAEIIQTKQLRVREDLPTLLCPICQKADCQGATINMSNPALRLAIHVWFNSINAGA